MTRKEIKEGLAWLSHINEVNWDRVYETIQDLKQEFANVGCKIAGMCKEHCSRDPDELIEQLEEIDNELTRLKEEEKDQRKVIEECQETAETQQQAAMELFHDLGFDTSQLMTNNTLDFTNPDLLYNLQKQMERFKK